MACLQNSIWFHWNPLDVCEAALALTFVLVGGAMVRRAFTGAHLGRAYLVSTQESHAGDPRWYHRAYTAGFGLLLGALGLYSLWLIFVFYRR